MCTLQLLNTGEATESRSGPVPALSPLPSFLHSSAEGGVVKLSLIGKIGIRMIRTGIWDLNRSCSWSAGGLWGKAVVFGFL